MGMGREGVEKNSLYGALKLSVIENRVALISAHDSHDSVIASLHACTCNSVIRHLSFATYLFCVEQLTDSSKQ